MELDLKERQGVALEILCEFDKFCKKNKLIYVIEFGTLLGAIRHNGFIPWDDDIDITMPRKDYEKIKKISSIGQHILIDKIDDGKEHDTNFIKIYDDRTYSETINGDKRCGVYIDIYPMDYLPKSTLKKTIVKCRCMYYYCATKLAEKPTRKAKNKKLQFVYNLLSFLYQKKGRGYYATKLNNVAKNTLDGDYLSVVIEPDRMMKRMISKKDYYDIIRVPFEKYEFNIVRRYDQRLRLEYGDYMVLPPEKDRIGHSRYKFYRKTLGE